MPSAVNSVARSDISTIYLCREQAIRKIYPRQDNLTPLDGEFLHFFHYANINSCNSIRKKRQPNRKSCLNADNFAFASYEKTKSRDFCLCISVLTWIFRFESRCEVNFPRVHIIADEFLSFFDLLTAS